MWSILSLAVLAPFCVLASPPPAGPPPPQTTTKHYIGDFVIPSSSSTVDLKMISAFNATWGSSFFFAPNKDVPVPPLISIAGFVFLFEHKSTGRRVLFDMGIRKDLENLSPKSKELTSVFPFVVDKDVPDQLVAGGVNLSSIDSVIWSHSHPDHVGDMRKIPGTTRLYVGAGTLANGPGYPADPESLNVETDFTGHNITEIQFDGVKIAGQKSHDFFGDGSVFLLDLPGHLPGHLAALVRVTANPSTFVLLAGDAEHHIGLIRPSPGVPLPHACIHDLPALLQNFGANEYSDPFGNPAPQNASLSSDAVTALASIEKVKRFDAREDTWVVLTHDASLHVAPPSSKLSPDVITLFPATINDWKKNGWKETSKFAFLEAGNRANVFANDTVAH